MAFRHVPPGVEQSAQGSRSTTGAASELIACAELMRLGYYVFRCESPHAPFDLVAYRDGHCLRVEVKTVTFKVDRTGNEQYAPAVSLPVNDEWDLLAVVGRDADVFLFDAATPPLDIRNGVRVHYGYEPMSELATPSCGTLAGHRRHRSRDEPVCEPCRNARNAYQRRRYEKGRTS